MTEQSRLERLTKTIEDVNPAILAFLATILPFLTPFPIAFVTAISAETYLFGGRLLISWIFVVVLEGLGLLVTSYLTDAVLSFIRSKNHKEVWKIVLLSVVTVVYIAILIGLNVQLKATNQTADQTYLTIITLMCFLPLISGVLYGYIKWHREVRKEDAEEMAYTRMMEERREEMNRQDKMTRYQIKHGIAPEATRTFNLDTPPTAPKELKNSWKNRRHGFKESELQWIINNSRSAVAKKYDIPEGTAKNWIAGAREELDIRLGHVDSPDAQV